MLGAFQTRLTDDEIIVAVDVPKLSSDARFGYYKFCRKTGEFPERTSLAPSVFVCLVKRCGSSPEHDVVSVGPRKNPSLIRLQQGPTAIMSW